MRQSVLLVGGSGFIGKHLVRRLYPEYNLVVADKYIDESFFSSYPDVQVIEQDLISDKLPTTLPSPDFIINLASIVTAERDLSLFDKLISSNLKILLNLYERFHDDGNLKLFIQFGSSEEYGSAPSPYNEDMREEPNSPYALVKQLTTNTAMMLYRNYGFPTMVVRPGNLFGPGQNPTKFIPYVITQLKADAPLDVTLCEQKRDFIYVEDFTKAILAITKDYKDCIGEIINVSTGVSITLRNIIETAKEALGSKSKINYGAIPYRENEAMDLRCNTSRLDSILKKNNLINKLKELSEL